MKTHFAILESQANESDNTNYWSDPICGTSSEKVDSDWDMVNCQKCIKQKSNHESEMNFHMQNNINDMAGFVEFLEQEKLNKENGN